MTDNLLTFHWLQIHCTGKTALQEAEHSGSHKLLHTTDTALRISRQKQDWSVWTYETEPRYLHFLVPDPQPLPQSSNYPEPHAGRPTTHRAKAMRQMTYQEEEMPKRERRGRKLAHIGAKVGDKRTAPLQLTYITPTETELQKEHASTPTRTKPKGK